MIKKFLILFGFIFVTILLELFYLNIQLVNRINDIEHTQKQYQFSIESLDRVSEKALNGIDQSFKSTEINKNK